jgi:hypothetical protein
MLDSITGFTMGSAGQSEILEAADLEKSYRLNLSLDMAVHRVKSKPGSWTKYEPAAVA